MAGLLRPERERIEYGEEVIKQPSTTRVRWTSGPRPNTLASAAIFISPLARGRECPGLDRPGLPEVFWGAIRRPKVDLLDDHALFLGST